MSSISKYKPAVSRKILFLLAGLLWSAAGIMLCQYAIRWLMAIELNRKIEFGFMGIILAVVFYQWGFKSIVKKNLLRLHALPERPCVFAFSSLRSYFLIAVMMTIGILLRSSAIPKYDLAVPYEAMGGALLLGSVKYFLSWRELIIKR